MYEPTILKPYLPNISSRIRHVYTLISYRSKDNDNPPFLKLIFTYRMICIIRHYFSQADKFEDLWNIDLSKDSGWLDFMTLEERTILHLYAKALLKITKRYDNIHAFNNAEIQFRKYREKRWLSSQKILQEKKTLENTDKLETIYLFLTKS